MIANKEILDVVVQTPIVQKTPKRMSLLGKIIFGNYQLMDKIMSGAEFDPLLRNNKEIEEKQKNN